MVSTWCSRHDNSSLPSGTNTDTSVALASRVLLGVFQATRGNVKGGQRQNDPLTGCLSWPQVFLLPPSPPQSESSLGLNRSLLRHPMRTYQISLASWQPVCWSGYLGFQFLKTAFQKALFFFLRDGNRVRIQCLMLASNLQSFRRNFIESSLFYSYGTTSQEGRYGISDNASLLKWNSLILSLRFNFKMGKKCEILINYRRHLCNLCVTCATYV